MTCKCGQGHVFGFFFIFIFKTKGDNPACWREHFLTPLCLSLTYPSGKEPTEGFGKGEALGKPQNLEGNWTNCVHHISTDQ